MQIAQAVSSGPFVPGAVLCLTMERHSNLIELTLHHNHCTDAQEQMCCRAPGRQSDPGGFCFRLSAHSVFGAGRQNVFHRGAAGRQVPAEPGPGVCWRLWCPRRNDRDLSASAAPVHPSHDMVNNCTRVAAPISMRWCAASAGPVQSLLQVGLGLVLHEADNLIDTSGIPLDDIVAIGLLLFFGIRTLQVGRLVAAACSSAADLQSENVALVTLFTTVLQEAGNADDKAKEEEEEAQESVTAFNGEMRRRLAETCSRHGFLLHPYLS